MENLKNRLIEQIDATTISAVSEIESANSKDQLENIRNRYIGYKGAVANHASQMRNVGGCDRPEVGDRINESVNRIKMALDSKSV